jgi:hypothetical protein
VFSLRIISRRFPSWNIATQFPDGQRMGSPR